MMYTVSYIHPLVNNLRFKKKFQVSHGYYWYTDLLLVYSNIRIISMYVCTKKYVCMGDFIEAFDKSIKNLIWWKISNYDFDIMFFRMKNIEN